MGQRRKFTNEEKNAILAEAEQQGVGSVLRTHRLSYSVFHRWKMQLRPAGTKKQVPETDVRTQLQRLLLENERLKKIIAQMALDNQIIAEKLESYRAG